MTDYQELKRLAERAADTDQSIWDLCGAGDDFEKAAQPEIVLALIAEVEALRDAATLSAMLIKELDLLFGRYILAMQAAVIEDEHGKTETTGMDWIFNSLAGPGQLPPEEETDAQAYFDREIVAVDNGIQEVMAFHDQRRKAKSKETGNGQAT